jgi:hypothetical protein
MQMNWVSYLINELEKDCREAQDQGYEFHFSWLLILIAFVTWEMPEGATFLEVRAIRTTGHEVHHLVVYERYGKAVAVKQCLPHLLPTVEAGH